MTSFSKLIVVMLTLFLAACAPKFTLFPDSHSALQEFTLEGHGRDKVVMIPIEGTISHLSKSDFLQTHPNMVQEITNHLKRAEKDDHVKAVLLKIDSPGGSTTASDLLYHEIMEFKRRSGKPVVAAMMNIAASGGYYISLPADKILAHPTTITGSVGVIFTRPSAMGLSEKIGLGVAVSKSGINKDMGSPFREQTKEEEAIFQNITSQLGQRFLNLVAKHRKLDQTRLKKIATARIFLADQALELGMIDQIGYLSDAVIQTKQLAGLPPDAKLVVYRRSEFSDDNIYNPATRYNSKMPGGAVWGLMSAISNAEAGFYYLWSPGLATP